MDTLKIEGKVYPFARRTIEIPRLDLPKWLAKQSVYPKVYLQDRDTQTETVALGNLLTFTHVPVFDDPEVEVRLFGGMHFPSTKKDTLWRNFPKCAFWLPTFEIVQDKESAHLHLNFINEEASYASIETLHFATGATPVFYERDLLHTQDSIGFDLWKKDVAHCIYLMQNQEIEKIVLGRKKTLTFSQPLCPWELLDRVKQKAQNATSFVFQLTPQNAFLGSTPEKLFYRKGGAITIDAVAGTRKRGQSYAEDLVSENELRHSEKERYEFLSVKETLHRTLLPFTEELKWWERDQILKTAIVQHLYNQATAILKKGVTDQALISALHPTPAVAGIGKEKALHLLSEMESFQRGWYAAPIGWVSAFETNLSIAIRSTLIEQCSLHIFAAAGIVPASIAKNEWEEIDNKMRVILYGCGCA